MTERVLRGPPEEIAAALVAELELDQGGVLAVVAGSGSLAAECARAVGRRAPAVEVELRAESFEELNRARDRLLGPNRLVLVPMADAGGMPSLLRAAPDLADWISFMVVLEAPRAPEQELRAEHRRYLERVRAATKDLNLTGLLPGLAQDWRIPLEELYLALAEPLGESRRAMVLGAPGSGKSTHLRYLALRGAEEGLRREDAKVLPVLFPAVDFADALRERLRPLGEFVVERVTALGAEHGRQLVDWAGAEVLVLIDALDEVPEGSGLAALIAALEEYAGGAPGRLVVSSRPVLGPRWWRLRESFARVEVKAPSPEQALIFARRMLEAAPAVGDGAAAGVERLRGAVGASSVLAQLAQTPLTLAFLVMLQIVEGRLPNRRVPLYHRLAELLVERWNAARSLSRPRASVALGEGLRVLAPLAWWALEHHPSGRLPAEELREQIVEQLIGRGEPREVAASQASGFLERLRRDLVLLIPEDGRWSFFHPTLVEYLAGVELARNRRLREELMRSEEGLFEPALKEVVLFAAGELGLVRGDERALAELVDAILRQSRRSGEYDARLSSLVSGLLIEDPGLTSAQIAAVVERAAELRLDQEGSGVDGLGAHHRSPARRGASPPALGSG